MMAGISPINMVSGLDTVQQVKPKPTVANMADTFAKELGGAMEKVNQSQMTAQTAVSNMALGKTDNLHNVMVKVQKAEITLQTAVQVRDKVVGAYQEIMRMQV